MGFSTIGGSFGGGAPETPAGDGSTQLAFKTISVSGQSDVVADTVDDTLTLAAGSNVTITTTAGTDTVTIASSGGGSALNGIDDQSSSLDDCITILDAEVVINEDGDNQDFRVEGDTVTSLLHCDAGNDRVGIGTATPGATLHIHKDLNAADDLGDFDNYQLVISGGTATNDTTGLLLTGSSDTYGGSAIVHYDTGAGQGDLAFLTKRSGSAEPPTESLRLKDDGTVGIGTSDPDALLEIAEENFDAEILVSAYHDTEATAPIVRFRKADNTEASPAAVDDNAVLGVVDFLGHDGTNFERGAKIEARIDGTPTNQGASCALLMSMDTSSFVDSSTNSISTTVNGATQDSSDKKYGTSSMSLDGSNDYVSVAANSALAVGTDHTWEMWVKFETGGIVQLFNSFGSTSTKGHFAIERDNGSGNGEIKLSWNTGSGWTTVSATYASGVFPTGWNHYAFVKEGSTWTGYLNGTSFDTDSDSSTVAANFGTTVMDIGRYQNDDGTYAYYASRIDDLRITQSAVYTSSFTAPDQIASAFNDLPTELTFWTTPDNTSTAVERLSIKPDGRGLSSFTAKAWANWEVPSGTVTLNGSHNVSSITDNSVGSFTVNFTNNSANTTYAVVGSAVGTYNGSIVSLGYGGGDTTWQWTDKFEIECRGNTTGTTVRDPEDMCAIVFGD